MSNAAFKATIHGTPVIVDVQQGTLSPAARGALVGHLVRLARELTPEEFGALISPNLHNSEGAQLLNKLDDRINAKHVKRYADEASLICSIRTA